METIKEAKAYLNAHYKEGVECPCCTQFVKLYRRNIYARIARLLISLYHLDRRNPGYYHVDDICRGITEKGPADFPKLIHWKFIVEQEKDPEDTSKRTSGTWMITDRGKRFVKNEIVVAKYVYLLFGKAHHFDGPEVSIIDCLGKDFNYADIMRYE